MSSSRCILNNSGGDDDDDDDIIGMRQAFPIPSIPENFDPSIPPSTGEEYLQHVLFESKKYADVFIAERVDAATLNAPCDSKMLHLKPSLLESPFEPPDEWKTKQISEFIRLRNLVLDIRLKSQHRKQLPITIPQSDAKNSVWQAFLADHEPLLSVILLLRQEQLQRILQVLVEIRVDRAFSVRDGAWVYAVCASLDHPLSREACGELRDIARKCACDRKLKTDPHDKELVMMNLLITLVVKYFKQQDLDRNGEGTG